MRTAGVVALIALVAVLGTSTVATRVRESRAVRPDVFGTIQLYGNGTVVIETPTAGLREVGVDALTLVRDRAGTPARRDGGPAGVPATLADLRPGRPAALWLRFGLNPVPVADQIDVWDKGR